MLTKISANTIKLTRVLPMNINDLNIIETVEAEDVIGGCRNRFWRGRQNHQDWRNRNSRSSRNMPINHINIQVFIVNNFQFLTNIANIIAGNGSTNIIDQSNLASSETQDMF
ncbi:hypothetical protein [Anabaena sp. CS-542/02]|uniref:hypothetical protein n=1 Tax=Anabaena sp. CS-542/02 TaxID=3021719 RepID=UPI00232C291B|nr:hypothetical protein [Anabaena sp. CS-542/02]MDB9446655.1 hypothetical protein [Anabaena sp. CS-542/02]